MESGQTSQKITKSVVADGDEGFLSNAFYSLRRLYIPTSPFHMLQAQKLMFEKFVRVPVAHKKYILNSGEYLNYIEIENDKAKTDSNPSTLVLMHGYGSGLAFFFANYDKFASQFDRVIAMDWLGMGGSSRPSSFPKVPYFGSFDPAAPVDFFIDHLEEFRVGTGLKDFVIAGHSLGGYLSARYAMKYHHPGLEGLVLLSPAGLAPHPPIEKQVPSHQVNSRFMSWAGYLWEKDFTPQAYVRLLGHWGSNTVGKSLSRRFGSDRWLPEEAAALTNYLYHISALPASGEYALNAILKPLVHMHGDQQRPHVYAREPIHPSSLAPLSPQRNSYCPEIGIPILLLYGDDDWICFPDVEEYVNDVKREGVDIKLSIIRNAGHHLYMDNVDHCHEEINKWHDRVKHYRNKSRVQAECKDGVSDH